VTARPVAGQPGDQLRPADEIEPGRDQRLALHRVAVGLPHVHVGHRLAEHLAQVLLKRCLVARRISHLARGRVERDQRSRQPEELVTPLVDRLADVALSVGQGHRANTSQFESTITRYG
jgi:hypothetical protein